MQHVPEESAYAMSGTQKWITSEEVEAERNHSKQAMI